MTSEPLENIRWHFGVDEKSPKFNMSVNAILVAVGGSEAAAQEIIAGIFREGYNMGYDDAERDAS